MLIDGTKITLKTFCKIFNIKSPENIDDETFIKKYISDHNLDLQDVVNIIKQKKQKSSVRRKQRHKELMGELKKADEKFFKEHGACQPKNRNCLRCNIQFYSSNGNRVCTKCHKINQEFIEGFHD